VWSIAVLVLGVLAPRRGWASDGSTAMQPGMQPAAWLSEYRVVPGCPDAGAFSEGVAERQSLQEVAAPAAVRVRVNITRGAARTFSGTLEVVDGPEVTRRAVAGGDCGEVALALGVIAAMALESRPASRERTAPAEAALAAPSASRAAAPLPAEDTQDAVSASPGASANAGVKLGAFGFALVHGAAAPARALGAGAALGVEWRGPSLWQPALSLGAFRVASEQRSFAGGAARARFALSAAQGLLCPWRWPAQGRWGLRPCLQFELGWLEGSSSGPALIEPRTQTGLWASGALAGRGDLDPWGPLRVSLLGSAVIPLTRHDFSFSPDDTVAFRVPGLSWQASVSVGVWF
jgi:hypothetical protein